MRREEKPSTFKSDHPQGLVHAFLKKTKSNGNVIDPERREQQLEVSAVKTLQSWWYSGRTQQNLVTRSFTWTLGSTQRKWMGKE